MPNMKPMTINRAKAAERDKATRSLAQRMAVAPGKRPRRLTEAEEREQLRARLAADVDAWIEKNGEPEELPPCGDGEGGKKVGLQ